MSLDPAEYLRLDGQGSLGATASGIAFATATGDVLEASCCAPGVFRVRAGPVTGPDYAIVHDNAHACSVAQSPPGTWTLAVEDVALEIVATPLRLRLLYKGVALIQSATDARHDGTPHWPTIGRSRHGGQWVAALSLASGAAVYGFGEKSGPLDKRGLLVESQVEEDSGGNNSASPGNVPFAWSAGPAGTWGVFVHSPGRVMHGVGVPQWSQRSYIFTVDDDALDVFLLAADTPAGMLERYAIVTGRAPAVPLWSLGLWLGCESHASAEATLASVSELRQRQIPFDAVTLGPGAVTPPEELAGASATQGGVAYGSPVIEKINAEHARVCARESPYVPVAGPLFHELAARGYLLIDGTGQPYIQPRERSIADGGKVATVECGIVDFTRADAFDWWRDAHAMLFDDGVAALASDEGGDIPEDAYAANGDSGRHLHNVYPLLYQRCLYEATTHFQRPEDAPPVIVASGGWAGSQGQPVATGGAAQRDWEGLASTLRSALSAGMSGVPYRSIAIGGGWGPPPSPELALRWLQLAVFASHLHVRNDSAHAPWALGEAAEAITRKWLAFRYRLLPYLQQAADHAAATSLPVMRAMPLAFPGNALTRHVETQFMCGDSLLVAPILEAGGEVEIVLPPGAWYDLNSRQRFPGQRVLRYRAALDQFPVFGREGYALPLGKAVAHTGEIDPLRPLDALWMFGRPQAPLAGYVQAAIGAGPGGAMTLDVAPDLAVEFFGDAAGVAIARRPLDPEA